MAAERQRLERLRGQVARQARREYYAGLLPRLAQQREAVLAASRPVATRKRRRTAGSAEGALSHKRLALARAKYLAMKRAAAAEAQCEDEETCSSMSEDDGEWMSCNLSPDTSEWYLAEMLRQRRARGVSPHVRLSAPNEDPVSSASIFDDAFGAGMLPTEVLNIWSVVQGKKPARGSILDEPPRDPRYAPKELRGVFSCFFEALRACFALDAPDVFFNKRKK